MSSRKSVIAMFILVAFTWTTAIVIHIKTTTKAVFKETQDTRQQIFFKSISNSGKDCCVSMVEECDTIKPLNRFYITDCGITFYSYRHYEIGDTVKF